MYCETEKYDPAVYGQLRAKFLRELDSKLSFDDVSRDEEARRQALIRDIKEKKLSIIK